MTAEVVWHEDVLPGFSCHDIPLPDAERAPEEPADVELTATLVRHDAGRFSRSAVLYVHGWNDYFFQTHLARYWADQGYAFYAVDLRRYGRSLREGQLLGFVTDLADYDVELSAAVAELRATHDHVIMMGHSTGGLITSIWVADHPGQVDAVVLNSPWLDLQATAMARAFGAPMITAVGSRLPTTALKIPDPGFYTRTIHVDHDGEWDYDRQLKSSPAALVRVGWLRAVLKGHQRVADGLGIEAPVLVMASRRSVFGRRWSEDMRTADTVLDVGQIAARAPSLGTSVTIERIGDGLHDLVLSPAPVRRRVFAVITRWLGAYGPTATSGPAPDTERTGAMGTAAGSASR